MTMDPDETLKCLREYINLWRRFNDDDCWRELVSTCSKNDIADNIVEYFEALDTWMSKGGFSPWNKQVVIGKDGLEFK